MTINPFLQQAETALNDFQTIHYTAFHDNSIIELESRRPRIARLHDLHHELNRQYVRHLNQVKLNRLTNKQGIDLLTSFKNLLDQSNKLLAEGIKIAKASSTVSLTINQPLHRRV